MSIAIVTGSAGLIGSEASRFFSNKGFDVIGIDNDMRRSFFGEEASTAWMRKNLELSLKKYKHINDDIRDENKINLLFKKYGKEIKLVVHAAAQPSHDWAAKSPIVDFTVNALGTLILLEATRIHCPEAVFIFTSTNKVYGDTPNRLPLIENEKRYEINIDNPYFKNGISEDMSIDHTLHSVFGASKVAADVLVQEYGKYFGMKTGIFRGGCLTGPNHSGTALHGFLSYLMKCAVSGNPYVIYGYKGKQVRDNIHSEDLVGMFYEFFQKPRCGEVYNAGGGRFSNCSVLEAIEISEKICNRKINFSYNDRNRIGDHIWWISDTSKFKSHYPTWVQKYNVESILAEIYERNFDQWLRQKKAA